MGFAANARKETLFWYPDIRVIELFHQHHFDGFAHSCMLKAAKVQPGTNLPVSLVCAIPLNRVYAHIHRIID
jgi:hypothetical protein